jgi:fructose-specific phosphotransferase system IIC component
MRVFSGIVLGFLMFELLWRLLFRVTNTDPYVPASISFEAFAIAFGLLFALLSGYIASFIGGRPHFTAAKVVGLLIALGAIVVMVRRGIGWPQVSALLFMAPAAVVGGYSYVLSRRASDDA